MNIHTQELVTTSPLLSTGDTVHLRPDVDQHGQYQAIPGTRARVLEINPAPPWATRNSQVFVEWLDDTDQPPGWYSANDFIMSVTYYPR